jgi:hypothetical protein
LKIDPPRCIKYQLLIADAVELFDQCLHNLKDATTEHETLANLWICVKYVLRGSCGMTCFAHRPPRLVFRQFFQPASFQRTIVNGFKANYVNSLGLFLMLVLPGVGSCLHPSQLIQMLVARPAPAVSRPPFFPDAYVGSQGLLAVS